MPANDDDWLDQLAGRTPGNAESEALRRVLLEYCSDQGEFDEVRSKRRQLALLKRLRRENPTPLERYSSRFPVLAMLRPLALAAGVTTLLIGGLGLLVSQRPDFKPEADPGEIRVGASAPPVIAEQTAPSDSSPQESMDLQLERKAQSERRAAQSESKAIRRQAEIEAAIQARKREASRQEPSDPLSAYPVVQVADVGATLRRWKRLFIKHRLPYRIMTDPKGKIIEVQVGSPPSPALSEWLKQERLTPDADGWTRIRLQKKKL